MAACRNLQFISAMVRDSSYQHGKGRKHQVVIEGRLFRRLLAYLNYDIEIGKPDVPLCARQKLSAELSGIRLRSSYRQQAHGPVRHFDIHLWAVDSAQRKINDPQSVAEYHQPQMARGDRPKAFPSQRVGAGPSMVALATTLSRSRRSECRGHYRARCIFGAGQALDQDSPGRASA